jgi:hypothetical protein
MSSRRIVPLAAAVLALAAPAARAGTAPSSALARSAGAAAYLYGLAPLDEQRTIGRFPANELISVTRLATPAERLVPLPNVDTLYTTARLDLSAGPLVLRVPAEPGRYYVMQFLDAYTNSFAYVGSRTTGSRAGRFAITGPGWHGHLPRGLRRISAPTPTVWLLGRTLVRGPRDLARANRIQHAYSLSSLAGTVQPALFLAASPLRLPPLPSGLAFYDALDAVLAADPPPAAERPLLRRLAAAGLGPGRVVSQEHLPPSIRAGLLAGLALGARQLGSYSAHLKRASERAHRGWLVPPAATGDFGSDFRLRAYIAQTALAANVPAEAEYPVAFVDSRLRALSGGHRYVVHFAAGELPPVRAFWSLTMYGANLFLVTNPLDRYALGDRTPGLRFGPGGSLDIVLSARPPRGSRSNWLPAPRGRFVVALRLYEPGPAVLSGRWLLPSITRVG